MIHGAGVILISPDKKVLLNKRDSNPQFYKNVWSYIGGRLESNETPEQGARRELLEETGYKAGILHLLESEVYDHESGRKQIRHVYWTEYDEIQKIQCNEGLEMKFITIEEMENLKLIPGQKELIKLALESYNARNG